ncbi:LytTR family DNA-binding domain-containing protein [Rufibacter sp. LB8]|uniref:LytTR family DNA-binding domain-containing protein n=1 Tax=Rufibacter sp. LB8 TaxID=2777781 RepID=UPI00178C51C9|nr:LytTR family DNA-binding domain-containing protein [Rufibacter sp. LB8]
MSELTLSRTLVLSVLFGVIIAFTLIVFQPFGSYNWHDPSKNLILAGYGLVAAVSVFLNFYALRRLLPTLFVEARWTVAKEIIWNLAHFGTAGFLCTAYGAAVKVMPFSLAQISYMTMIAFFMGLVPAVLLVLINYVFMLQRYKPLTPLPHKEPAPPLATPAQDLLLTSENEKDALTLPAHNLLFIEADDNYCTVVYLEQGSVHKKLLRTSLSRLESQTSALNIVRCHRSYLVNLDKVESVSGNAQGYRLHFPHTPGTVPVARASSGVVKAAFAPI